MSQVNIISVSRLYSTNDTARSRNLVSAAMQLDVIVWDVEMQSAAMIWLRNLAASLCGEYQM